MFASLLILALTSQTPDASVQREAPKSPLSYLRPQLLIGSGAELGLSSWAGPLSPSGSGPRSNGVSLVLGIELTGSEETPYWSQKRSHVGLLLSGASYPDGGVTAGLALGGRLDLLSTIVRPYLGYEVGARLLALEDGPALFGLEFVPLAGVQVRLGDFAVLADAGPRFFGGPSGPNFQWWRARVALSVPL